eukprot:469972_1
MIYAIIWHLNLHVIHQNPFKYLYYIETECNNYDITIPTISSIMSGQHLQNELNIRRDIRGSKYNQQLRKCQNRIYRSPSLGDVTSITDHVIDDMDKYITNSVYYYAVVLHIKINKLQLNNKDTILKLPLVMKQIFKLLITKRYRRFKI